MRVSNVTVIVILSCVVAVLLVLNYVDRAANDTDGGPAGSQNGEDTVTSGEQSASVRLTAGGHPILTQFCEEEGFVDCVFAVSNVKENEGRYSFHVTAEHDGTVVGMDVDVVTGIQGAFDGDMNLIREHVYHEGVVFRRSGPESDDLVRVIAGLYGQSLAPLKMTDVETFTAIPLHQGAIDMTREAVKIKVFGRDAESCPAEDYYESYFNLDMPNGLVYWNEKDPEYREPLIRGLTQE